MIRNIEINGKTYFFVSDDLGMPVSFGYETEQQAEEVAALIESSNGLATIPPGVEIKANKDYYYVVSEMGEKQARLLVVGIRNA